MDTLEHELGFFLRNLQNFRLSPDTNTISARPKALQPMETCSETAPRLKVGTVDGGSTVSYL